MGLCKKFHDSGLALYVVLLARFFLLPFHKIALIIRFNMSNYKHILYNLKIFERLHDVTKSIKLVAFTKFKKIQHRVKLYNESLASFVWLTRASELLGKNLRNYLVVPLTSDKGCCGPINTHLLSVLDGYLRSVQRTNIKLSIVLIGKKGKVFVKYRFRSNYLKYVQNVFNTSLSFISTLKINEEIQKVIFDKCVFIFNHFNNINEQRVYIFDFLSFDQFVDNIKFLADGFSKQVVFFASVYGKHLINAYGLHDLYEFVFSTILLHSLLDHEISELGGRITSMEKSSQNALEMYNSLQIQYNKARQSYITNQLIEICSASSAISVASK